MRPSVAGKNNPNYRSGFAVGKERMSFYHTWMRMRQVCSNPNNPKYKRYGGRGIKVCEEWQDVKNFAEWCFQNGWEEGLTIDRIDNDGDYEPSNCRWVSKSENSRKKSTTKISKEDAKEIRKQLYKKELELAEQYGVSHGTIWFIKKGYTHVKEGECTLKLKERIENK